MPMNVTSAFSLERACAAGSVFLQGSQYLAKNFTTTTRPRRPLVSTSAPSSVRRLNSGSGLLARVLAMEGGIGGGALPPHAGAASARKESASRANRRVTRASGVLDAVEAEV